MKNENGWKKTNSNSALISMKDIFLTVSNPRHGIISQGLQWLSIRLSVSRAHFVIKI